MCIYLYIYIYTYIHTYYSVYIYIYAYVCTCLYTYMHIYIYIYTYTHVCIYVYRGPNPNNNSLIRKQCCKRRMESLICRWFPSYQGIILRVRVPLFASDLSSLLSAPSSQLSPLNYLSCLPRFCLNPGRIREPPMLCSIVERATAL